MATPPIYPGTTNDPDPSTARDRAWLEVDDAALRHNAAVLAERARVPLMPMVKANAYGLGAVATCRALGVPFRDQPRVTSGSPWGVGVAALDEAAELRDAGCEGRILCSTPLRPQELARAASLGVRPALHRPEDIAFWATVGGPGWHLAIDTGMARAGVRWTDVGSLRDAIAAHPPEGVFTHFHSADESVASMDDQDGRFQAALAQLVDVLPTAVIEHRDNSGAIASREAGSPGQLARPGIALYAGMFAETLGLRQTAHLRARIVDIRHVEAGESVSYGATWRASGLCRVATLAIGYADGYRRHLSNAGVVLIHGVRCPVVGRVTMDMTMVDVSHLPCVVGDVATMIGADGSDMLTMEWVADRGGVSPYELLVGLTMRVPMLRRPAIT